MSEDSGNTELKIYPSWISLIQSTVPEKKKDHQLETEEDHEILKGAILANFVNLYNKGQNLKDEEKRDTVLKNNTKNLPSNENKINTKLYQRKKVEENGHLGETNSDKIHVKNNEFTVKLKISDPDKTSITMIDIDEKREATEATTISTNHMVDEKETPLADRIMDMEVCM